MISGFRATDYCGALAGDVSAARGVKRSGIHECSQYGLSVGFLKRCAECSRECRLASASHRYPAAPWINRSIP
jgi:hypothetical protein